MALELSIDIEEQGGSSISIYPHALYTGEAWEAEVKYSYDGDDEVQLLCNRYPYHSEEEAYEAAGEVIAALEYEIFKFAEKIMRPYWRDKH